jgi:hypothetical protein
MKQEDLRSDTNGNGSDGARPERRREGGGVALDALISAQARAVLDELYRFWDGGNGSVPEDAELLRSRLRTWMRDPVRVEERATHLPRRLATVLEDLIGAPRFQKSWSELARSRALAYLSPYDLEACLAALARRGFVSDGDERRFERFGERLIGVPHELAEGLLARRREKQSGLYATLTLRGHLDQVYSDPAEVSRISPQRLRELYKMYSQESAAIARIERLPEGMRKLVEKAILEFGGILPRQLFERMESDLPHWNGRRWRLILEQSLVGTVRELDLSRYGVQLQDETLVVFNELVLAWLRHVAVPSDPDRPHEELALGIDLASNVSRFLAYIDENGVRFTVRGEIFKTTEKKILQHLIPDPGREVSRQEALGFIFRFAKRSGLIDRTGKRTFKVTTAGRDWRSHTLAQKQQLLLDYVLEERPYEGVAFHQVRMRQVFLRFLKRLEPQVWYDLMYLPFVARNQHLAALDDPSTDGSSDGTASSRFAAMEDPQRLAWGLVKWVRSRLHLMGIVDLGYDEARRPVAMRLTSSGARLFGLERPGSPSTPRVGSVVVTPDFEVVLFPTGDDAELVHDLDRFCVREKLGSLLHFRVTEESVTRALKEGLGVADVRRILENHSRTPVPQNVLFSIGDWALRAGLMRLSDELVLVCEEPEVLRRFQQDPGTRKYVAELVDERSLRLKGRATPRRMQALLRELGYLVELGEPLGR